ncbi:MAG: flippase activity-associated protein Agl23 [Chloroflexota bacterium]|nr:MAG: hypothetical protein DLM70_17705 [Chloroflexota bacterium]
MADISIPSGRTTWLDRPLLPSRERVARLAVHWEAWAYTALILAGFLLRVYDLGLRAMHHDESLHAYFAWKLFIGQGYAYDPLMHGPLQFEVVPLFYLLFGDNEMAARLFAVLLGTILIGLPYFLRRYITRNGALLASAMLAISPAFVYFSRFIRDDIYLACFSLIMFIALVRYIEAPRPYLLYVLAAASALAMASMEAAYLTFFIFGTFVIFAALREYLSRTPGPVLAAIKGTSPDTWLTALSIFIVITVVCYSTFFTNPYGIWDTKHSFWLPGQAWSLNGLNPARKDIIGGLIYWKAQHSVQRGNEPTFYYLLLLPLYEQLALLFGVAGIVYASVRRSLVTTFLAWWSVMAFGLYSWAGEKMPWLVIHIALPLILLAGLFLGRILREAIRPVAIGVGVVALLLGALETHSTFLLNYVDGANPTEMLIYVQTSQDVPNAVNEIETLSRRLTGGLSLPVGLDTSDVGGWPFTWYMRHFTNVTETTSFTGPICGGRQCAVLLMLEPEYNQYSSTLNSQYVVQKYRWNWWFPQDYMQWFPLHMGAPFTGTVGPISGVGSPSDWQHVWNWLLYRKPFGDRGARWLYVLVRRDLVPGAKEFKSPSASSGPPVVAPVAALSSRYLRSVGNLAGTSGALSGPRGIAAGAHGELYVADTLNHRVVRYSSAGRLLGIIGGPGDGPGQFATRDSPQGVATGADGNVYVADTWHQRIDVFSPNGRLLRQWGGGQIGSGLGQFYGPRSLAVSSDGRVYVADTGNKRIQVFTTKGRYVSSWGTAGIGPGQFQEPSSVAIAPDGSVVVADFWNRRIQVFSPDGAHLRSWAVPSWVPGSYDEPYLAVDPVTRDVFASDPGHAEVLAFTFDGRALGALRSFQLSLPVGVAVPGTGHIAVSDPTQNRVSLFALSRPHVIVGPANTSRREIGASPIKR